MVVEASGTSLQRRSVFVEKRVPAQGPLALRCWMRPRRFGRGRRACRFRSGCGLAAGWCHPQIA